MKKIKNMLDYPVISNLYGYLLEENKFIISENMLKMNKDILEKLNEMDLTDKYRNNITEFITDSNTISFSDGFLNGYLTAVKVLKGKFL